MAGTLPPVKLADRIAPYPEPLDRFLLDCTQRDVEWKRTINVDVAWPWQDDTGALNVWLVPATVHVMRRRIVDRHLGNGKRACWIMLHAWS